MTESQLPEEIGLRRGSVEVLPYTDAWRVAFEQERELLEARFSTRFLAIEHIGSTSVPGLDAKPLIDMQAALRSLEDIDDVLEGLSRLGYQVMPERMYPSRIFLPKGPEERRTHHLNLVLQDSDEWRQPLLFRDQLRGDEDLRDRYAELKRELARRYPQDRQAYTDGKAALIQQIIATH